MFRIVAVLLACITFLQPNAALAQEHIVSPAELRQALRAASEKRQSDIKIVREFLGNKAAGQSLSIAGLDAQKIQNAVPVLDNEELSRLSGRVQAAQKEMVAGALSNQELTYIVIALAAAVLVLVLK
jgi:hypothetical protein